MKKLTLLFAYISLILSSCTKQLDIAILESRCKDFKILNPTQKLTNGNCPGGITSNRLEVTFAYSGDKECLNNLQYIAKFYNKAGNVVSPKSISIDSIFKTNPLITIGSGTATFYIEFEMNSAAEYEDLNNIRVNFSVFSETGNASNRLSVVEIMPCQSTVAPPSSTNGTVQVKSKQVSVSLWDNASEDGDIITIIVNGNVVASNVEIFHNQKTFSFTIDPTINNYISFYAVNEGTSSPNTASGTINDGFQSQSFDVGMNEGESISFNLVYNGL
jgi:hypothetical protein